MKLESLSFRDRFNILLEKRPSGVAGLRYVMLYGKSQFKVTQMTPEEFRNELIEQLIPFKYKSVVTNGIPKSWLVMKKGSYAVACIPYSELEIDDYKNEYAKRILRKALHAFPIIMEKGVFILYHGEYENWAADYKNFKVDKTALRPVIVQAVHFFDIRTGENANTRTSWGPIKFGFCGPTIERIEEIGNRIKHIYGFHQ